MSAKIYAVDFDGTLCENQWPEIGNPNRELIQFLKMAREIGHKVVLWTMREDDKLEAALEWCKARGLEFDAVNDNTEEMKQAYGNNPRKVFANVYIDDRNATARQMEDFCVPYHGQKAPWAV